MEKLSDKQIDLMCELMRAQPKEPQIIHAVGGKGVYHLKGIGLTNQAIDAIFDKTTADIKHLTETENLVDKLNIQAPTFKQLLGE